MKSIAIGTLKGGVGKSLVAFTIASFLQGERKKVLICDCDPQGNTSSNYGITSMDIATIGDILESNMENENKFLYPSDVVIEQPIANLPFIDIIPANIKLTATEMRLVSYTARETILNTYIKIHKKFFDKYDYIIYDLNPSLSNINQNALFASDSVLLVTDIDIHGINGCKLMSSLWSGMCMKLNKENNIKGLIVNRFDKRLKLSNDFISFVQANEDMQRLSFDTIIPENVKLKESILTKTPINYYDKKSTGYLAFHKLMQELEERGVV